MEEGDIYSCQQVADMLRVKKDTVYKWIKRGKVEATRYGFKRYVFTESQLTKLKEKAFGKVGGSNDQGTNS